MEAVARVIAKPHAVAVQLVALLPFVAEVDVSDAAAEICGVVGGQPPVCLRLVDPRTAVDHERLDVGEIRKATLAPPRPTFGGYVSITAVHVCPIVPNLR